MRTLPCAETICQLESTWAETVVVVAVDVAIWRTSQASIVVITTGIILTRQRSTSVLAWRRGRSASSWCEHKATMSLVVKATTTTATTTTTTPTKYVAVPLAHANQLSLA